MSDTCGILYVVAELFVNLVLLTKRICYLQDLKGISLHNMN